MCINYPKICQYGSLFEAKLLAQDWSGKKMSQSLRSTNRLSANIDESTIISVIREKFDLSSDSTIELVSIEVDEEEQKSAFTYKSQRQSALQK